MDWYINMNKLLNHSKDNVTPVDSLEGDEDSDEEVLGRLGSGEMQVYAIDYLNEKSRREYKSWEKGIREQIAQRMRTKLI